MYVRTYTYVYKFWLVVDYYERGDWLINELDWLLCTLHPDALGRTPHALIVTLS